MAKHSIRGLFMKTVNDPLCNIYWAYNMFQALWSEFYLCCFIVFPFYYKKLSHVLSKISQKQMAELELRTLCFCNLTLSLILESEWSKAEEKREYEQMHK
jgi:hypothetical protein